MSAFILTENSFLDLAGGVVQLVQSKHTSKI